MSHLEQAPTGYTSVTQANNWYLRVQNEDRSISIYPVAVWASYGFNILGLVSMFKGESPKLYTPPPHSVSQYVHGDQLTDDEKLSIKKAYHF